MIGFDRRVHTMLNKFRNSFPFEHHIGLLVADAGVEVREVRIDEGRAREVCYYFFNIVGFVFQSLPFLILWMGVVIELLHFLFDFAGLRVLLGVLDVKLVLDLLLAPIGGEQF